MADTCILLQFHFSFSWVINAGSYSNSDEKQKQKQKKKNRFITTNEKKVKIEEVLCKNKCHCRVHQKQIHDMKSGLCAMFFFFFKSCSYVHITW